MDGTDGATRTADERSRRATALRALAEDTRIGPDGARPSPALEEALRVFGTERALVLAVHQRWQVCLLARLDQVLENATDDVHDDVVRTVDELSRSLPGFAALLREHSGDPSLAAARRRLADYVGQACPCGRAHPLVAPASPSRQAAGCAVLHGLALGASWLRRLARDPAGHLSGCGRSAHGGAIRPRAA